MPTVRIDPLPRIAPSARHPLTVNVRNLPANGHIVTHQHAWAQLACTLHGAMRIRVGSTTWIVPPTRAVWIPPRVDHEVFLVGEVALRTVYVDASAAPRALNTCEVIDISPLMRELIVTLGTVDPKDSPDRYDALGRALLEEMRNAPTLSFDIALPEDRRLRSLCEALLEDPGAALSLEDWAPRVGASARTLARLFQLELGMTFGQWRQRVRLAHAASLVSIGTPLAQVAASLGYESASAFSAMFKRALGRPPSAFFAADAKP
jgi:AraC-like DNA-binding protein